MTLSSRRQHPATEGAGHRVRMAFSARTGCSVRWVRCRTCDKSGSSGMDVGDSATMTREFSLEGNGFDVGGWGG